MNTECDEKQNEKKRRKIITREMENETLFGIVKTTYRETNRTNDEKVNEFDFM